MEVSVVSLMIRISRACAKFLFQLWLSYMPRSIHNNKRYESSREKTHLLCGNLWLCSYIFVSGQIYRFKTHPFLILLLSFTIETVIPRHSAFILANWFRFPVNLFICISGQESKEIDRTEIQNGIPSLALFATMSRYTVAQLQRILLPEVMKISGWNYLRSKLYIHDEAL